MRFLSNIRTQLALCWLLQALLLVSSSTGGLFQDRECHQDEDCPTGFECAESLNRCLAKACIAREVAGAINAFDPVAFKNRVFSQAGVTDDILLNLKRDLDTDQAFVDHPIVTNLMATIQKHSYELAAMAALIQACESGQVPPQFHRELQQRGLGFSSWVGGLFGLNDEEETSSEIAEQMPAPTASSAPSMAPSLKPLIPNTQRMYCGIHIEGGILFDYAFTLFQESGTNSTDEVETQRFKRGCFGAELGLGSEVSIYIMVTANQLPSDIIGGSFLFEQDIGVGAVIGMAAGLYVTGEQWDSTCPMYLEVTLGGGISIGVGGSLCRTGPVY